MKFRSNTFKTVISLILISLATFTFLQNSLSSVIGGILVNMSPINLIILSSAIMIIVVNFILKLERGLIWIVHGYSFLLFVPTVLSFSNIITFGYMDLYSTSLRSQIVLLFGVVILVGNMILHYLSRVEEEWSKLVENGASEKSMDQIFSRQFLFISVFFIAAGGISFGFAILSQRIEFILSGILHRVPLVHLTIGIFGILMLFIMAFVYLKVISQGKID